MTAVLDSYADKVGHASEPWWWVTVAQPGGGTDRVLMSAPHPRASADFAPGRSVCVQSVAGPQKDLMLSVAVQRVTQRVMANPDTDPRSGPGGGS